jgi:hypothetical protein
MLPNLNSHTRHLSIFHSLPIILRLHLLHTCRLAQYARSVKIFAAGLPSTYDSRFRYSCSAYNADTLRFRCLRLFATASRFRPTQRFQLTTITDVAISTGDCAFGLQLVLFAYDVKVRVRMRFSPALGPAILAQVSACFRSRFFDSLTNRLIAYLELRYWLATITELAIRGVFHSDCFLRMPVV